MAFLAVGVVFEIQILNTISETEDQTQHGMIKGIRTREAWNLSDTVRTRSELK